MITLWLFPPEEFHAWRTLTGENLRSYGEYLRIMELFEEHLTESGMAFSRIEMTVSAMERELAWRRLPNTPEARRDLLLLHAPARNHPSPPPQCQPVQ